MLYVADTSDIPGQVLFISSTYTTKLSFTEQYMISTLSYSSVFIEGLSKFFLACGRNDEVPRKFAYRKPSGMSPLHTAYQKTIAYEKFYLPTHTESFSRTIYGK
jgi:hypothetical protein